MKDLKTKLKNMSRSKLAAKILDLPAFPSVKGKPGLILIQIDGLSYTQIERGLEKNRLPFLRQLIRNNGFEIKEFYSGVPSTTPAFQAELYFGEKTAVPAFEFFDPKTREHYLMYHSDSADRIARSAGKQAEPFLKYGSSYVNIYTGGADEARYCVQNMNLDSILKAVNPLRFLMIVLLYSSKAFRITGYAVLEAVLSMIDFFHGIVEKQNIFKELKFIPTRIFICVFLRELIRFRLKLDIKRGVRISHANLTGYDEQAHRRGPGSRFAHWTLKGIDDVIKDIYYTALRSNNRRYSLVIFSDHGQEAVESYKRRLGWDPESAIRQVLLNSSFYTSEYEGTEKDIAIAHTGPIGHIYLPFTLPEEGRGVIASLLVKKAGIPLVLFSRKGRVYGVNWEGVFDLLECKNRILGHNHPFQKKAAEDLARTCRHRFAGDLVISGWSIDQGPISFAIEGGAHGGPGSEETRGFILKDPEFFKDPGRPLDLRKNIIEFFS